MAYREDDRKATKGFRGITENVGKPGVRSTWTFVTNSISKADRTTWRIWYSGYNPKTPWRTAMLTPMPEGGDRYVTHASHETLRGACEWLSKLD